MKTTNLFVYGTLMRNYSRHEIIRQRIESGAGNFEGTAWVNGFELYAGPRYPVAVPGEGKIFGEIYRIPHEFLTGRLDDIEGFPHLFDRKQVIIANTPYWIYYQSSPPSGATRINSGKWSNAPQVE